MPLRIEPGAPTPEPDAQSPSPDTKGDAPVRACLGRYEILDVIGSGSMGAVFEARDPKLGRMVAVKTIRLAPCSEQDEEEFRARLLREAEAAARLTHPGIVTIFDVGHDENHEPYFVMEYVDGKGLDQLIKAKALSLEGAIDISIQLAEALDYAHRQGIVHRDIKPSNILITPEGRAKITDFGIAKVDISQITLPGVMLGTPAYMAPEQLLGGAVDGRADLFSLGVVLYIMTTGQKPFQGQDPDTICRRLLSPDPVPLGEIAPKLPAGLSKILGRALGKKPADRYQTGIDMAADLRDLQNGLEPRNINRMNSPREGSSGSNSRLAVGKSADAFGLKYIRGRGEGTLRFRDRTLVRLSKPALAVALLPLFIAVISVYQVVRHFYLPSPTTIVVRNNTPAPATPPVIRQQDSVTKDFLQDDEVTPATVRGKKPSVAAKPAVITAAKPRLERAPTKKPVERNVTWQPPKSAFSPEAVPLTTLHVLVEHSFSSGNISITSDGQLIYVRELTGTRTKHPAVLSHSSGYEALVVRVPPGQHVIGARVRSVGFDGSANIDANLSTDHDTTLHVVAHKGEGVQLNLE